MDKENTSHSRSGFLKKLPLAFFAALGIGLTGFKLQKLQRFNRNNFNTLSESEANMNINKSSSSETKQIKPEPPPKTQHSSDGL